MGYVSSYHAGKIFWDWRTAHGAEWHGDMIVLQHFKSRNSWDRTQTFLTPIFLLTPTLNPNPNPIITLTIAPYYPHLWQKPNILPPHPPSPNDNKSKYPIQWHRLSNDWLAGTCIRPGCLVVTRPLVPWLLQVPSTRAGYLLVVTRPLVPWLLQVTSTRPGYLLVVTRPLVPWLLQVPSTRPGYLTWW